MCDHKQMTTSNNNFLFCKIEMRIVTYRVAFIGLFLGLWTMGTWVSEQGEMPTFRKITKRKVAILPLN